MRATSPYSLVAVLILIGLLAASCQHNPLLRQWSDSQAEQQRLAEYRVFEEERMDFNRRLTDDLIADRIGLAPAIDLLTASNTDRVGVSDMIPVYFPAPTPEESTARHLLGRVEAALQSNPLVRAAVLARLGDEYAALFGHRPPTSPNSAAPPGTAVVVLVP